MIKIIADIESYWQISTGRGAGHFMDTLIDTDQHNLPFVSGKTLKGLFRDALNKLEIWQEIQPSYTENYFGSATQEKDRHNTSQGSLYFSNLQLLADEINALNENETLKSHLTKVITTTSIEHETGIVINKSLRSQQVAVPLRLEGEISLEKLNQEDKKIAFKKIQQASSLVTHIGAKKSRGYGQVKWTLELIGKGK